MIFKRFLVINDFDWIIVAVHIYFENSVAIG